MTFTYKLTIILMVTFGFIFIAAFVIAAIDSMCSEDCDYTEEDDDDDPDW